VEIKAFCHIEGARIAGGAVIGPFARLRPGTVVGERARIGNFVEAKNAVLGPGAKANHLTYLGDAVVGAGANIGAGTITANYDGFNKHRTEIGAESSIGSNTVLVAPVKVGRGAIVGAGSVITQSVSADALALGRGRQTEKPGWAGKFRESKGKLSKGTVIRHGDKAFRVTVTTPDGAILPTGPSNLRVTAAARPASAAEEAGARSAAPPAPRRAALARKPAPATKAASKAAAKPRPQPMAKAKGGAAKKARTAGKGRR
jgi:NDP-sugar pyrophosphorylase family protein